MNETGETYVLDTSALLAFIEGELGAEIVKKLLEQAVENNIFIFVSFMAFMEIYYITLQEYGEDEAEERLRLMMSLPVLRIESTEILGKLASYFKAQYHLSVADAWIAALAKEKNAILVHKDPEFEQIKAEVSVLRLPYKN